MYYSYNKSGPIVLADFLSWKRKVYAKATKAAPSIFLTLKWPDGTFMPPLQSTAHHFQLPFRKLVKNTKSKIITQTHDFKFSAYPKCLSGFSKLASADMVFWLDTAPSWRCSFNVPNTGLSASRTAVYLETYGPCSRELISTLET